MKLTEFYPTKQGRPEALIARDMESRIPITPVSGVVVSSSYTTTTLTENYNAGDRTLILVDAGSPITITLPQASISTGSFYIIKKIDGDAQVNIVGYQDGETIDGEDTLTLKSKYQYVWVACDGYDWWIIGGEYMGLQDAFESRLDTLNSLVEELLTESRINNLHLTSMSDEEIGDTDAC